MVSIREYWMSNKGIYICMYTRQIAIINWPKFFFTSIYMPANIPWEVSLEIPGVNVNAFIRVGGDFHTQMRRFLVRPPWSSICKRRNFLKALRLTKFDEGGAFINHTPERRLELLEKIRSSDQLSPKEAESSRRKKMSWTRFLRLEMARVHICKSRQTLAALQVSRFGRNAQQAPLSSTGN